MHNGEYWKKKQKKLDFKVNLSKILYIPLSSIIENSTLVILIAEVIILLTIKIYLYLVLILKLIIHAK